MLSVTNLTKRYGSETAVDGLSLSVERGEFLTLLGPSGCGKTTTLLSIAGHLGPTAGRVRLDGEDVTDAPPERRSMGVVFQRDALFPHMTARGNVAYALGPGDVDDRDERAVDYLDLVGMADHAGKYPDQLSGGQRRRVELARALVYEPDVLLLDEPLSGLDRRLRHELRSEIARVHAETDVTAVCVTHDQETALTLSDRIAVLRDGRLVGSGSPRDLYERPPGEFVASFLGPVSRLRATAVEDDPAALEWCGHRFELEEPVPGTGEVSLYLRPDAVGSSLAGDLDGRDVVVAGRVDGLAHAGPASTVRVETPDGSRVELAVDGFPDVRPGDDVAVGFDAGAPFAFAGDRRLSVDAVTAPSDPAAQDDP